MLELAHERQFVVSQQGWDNGDFEAQHSRRIEACLQQLEKYFDRFATDDLCRPSSPYTADLAHCWDPNTLPHTIPPLCLSADEVQNGEVTTSTSSLPSAPSAVSPARHSPINLKSTAANSDGEEGDDSPDMRDSWRQSVLHRSRTATSLPIHGNRALKFARQRRRHESKLATDLLPVSKKRSSQWMTDKIEDEALFAERRRSIKAKALRPGHDCVVQHDGT